MNELSAKATTLVELLRVRALHQPNQRAYSFQLENGDEVQLTYAELDVKARALGALIQSQGSFGDRALLLYQPGIDYIVAFFACLYAGVFAVPAYPPRQNGNLDRLQAVVTDAKATMALTTSAIAAGIERRFADTPGLTKLKWVATDGLADSMANEWKEPNVDSSTLAFLQYTSGSTSAPKGVMLTHGNLLSNLELIQNSFGNTSESHCVIWLPPYHDMGLIGGILQPLYTGYPMTAMAPVDFITKPLRWLETISRTQATVSGGPNFAYDLCLQKITPEQRDQLDLSSWVNAFTGAEPVRYETIERFSEFFAPSGFRKEAFYPCYGLAEGTLFVSGGLKELAPISDTFDGEALEENRVTRVDEATETTRTLVSSGNVNYGNQKVYVVNTATFTKCTEDEVGEIWVCGPSVAQGYWEREQQTEETFRAYLKDTGEGPFLRTGDLGFLRDGELYVTGRLKDLIIIRGRNHYPQDIEFTVQESHPAVHNGNGAAFSLEVEGEERLVIVQELERAYRKGDHEEYIQAIRQAIAEHHQLQVYAIVLIKPASIPKTSSGKIQRHACKDRFQKGTLDVIAASILDSAAEVAAATAELEVEAITRDQLLAFGELEREGRLVQYLLQEGARVLKVAPTQLDATMSLNSLGLDSLMAVELKNTVEENFGVELTLTRLLEGPSVSELAQFVLEQVGEGAEVVESDASHRNDKQFPLSYNQRSLWFIQKLDPENSAYNLSRAMRVPGELDLAALNQSFDELVQRHPLLRTTFNEVNEEPVQVVHNTLEKGFTAEDATAWSDAELKDRLAGDAHHPFDLEEGPLLRVNVYKREEDSVMLVTMHHIIVDFWSFGVFFQQLWSLFADLKSGAALPNATENAYADFVYWQNDMLSSAKGERLGAYWQEKLAGASTVLQLQTDKPRPPVQTYNGATKTIKISAELTQKLKTLAKEHNTTLYVTLLSAFQVLLHCYTGQEDILVGSPTAGRSSSKFSDVIGYYINPVVLRAQFADDSTFTEFLEQMRKTVLEALDSADYPFGLLVEKLQPKRDLSYSPLFQTMFTLQRSHVGDDEGLTALALGDDGVRMQAGGLTLETFQIEQRYAQLDLSLTMGEVNGALTGFFEFNTDLFHADTIERMGGHFETLLDGIAAHADQSIAKLQLLSDAEVHQLLVTWNDTATEVRDTTIHQLFEEQVARTPNAVALVFEDGELTFAELNEKANRLANYLRKHGVGPDVAVGICMERSLEMMVGLLGILKAGGGYLPLDPTYPVDRLAFMLEDAKVPVLLTQQRLLKRLPKYDAQVLAVDAAWETIAAESGDNPFNSTQSHNLAYMIYTSGSTGKPKGVQIEHRNAVNFFVGMDQRISCGEGDSILAVTSICFDISVLELFWTLTRGTKVVLLSEREASGGMMHLDKKTGNGMEFSLFYFAGEEGDTHSAEKYKLLIEGAKFADRNGFKAVWTPERHFHAFGGLYPSPSVMGSALAMITENVELRAGSVVLPLHSPIRVAEEWSVIDNLSNGRVSLSFASGWHADDFVFIPENYKDRTNIMFDNIEKVKKLWRGEKVPFIGGAGNEIQVKTLPRPIQPELPVWITSGGNVETFRRAGQIGANVLTHLLGQSVEEVAEKIAVYRKALAANGFDPSQGKVALMLHTYLGDTMDEVREKVREPFKAYLRTSIGLIQNLVRSMNLDVDLEKEEDLQAMLNYAFDRYFETSALFGTPDTCLEMTDRLKAIGVDEIACLIDFGVDEESVFQNFEHLNNLRRVCEREEEQAPTGEYSVGAQAVGHSATMMQCTPSLMKILFADEANIEKLQSLRVVMLGGEAMPTNLAAQLKAALPARLVNMYGPTEATVWTTTQEVTAIDESKASVAIGTPFANMRTYVLDKHLQPVPVGIPGELHIGGKGVARGYLNRPELNEEKFVPNPFVDGAGERLYKTGDLVRLLPDGTIDFLGRVDFQVKVRGFRIELGEIEVLLSKHETVEQAVVIVREDLPGDKRIVAYLLAKDGQEPDANDLREYVKKNLPEYMVPSAFVTMTEWPLTLNGKIDRKSLPAPASDQPAEEFIAPRTDLEEAIAEVWGELLGYEGVGVRDNFFMNGGHSLLATQLVSRLRKAFNIDIPLRVLFEVNTVEGLAREIELLLGAVQEDEQLAELLEQLENMSDEEVEAFLASQKGE